MMRRLSLSLACAFAISQANPSSGTVLRQVVIPTQFQGVWDADLRACEYAASDMRFYIGPKRMRFGDSVGEVRRVIRQNSQAITMLASFRSDGDPWKGEVRLRLARSGSELIVHMGRDSFPRYRCPTKRTSSR